MSDEILKQILAEMVEIRKLLSAGREQRPTEITEEERRELARIEALGIDSMTYFSAKAKRSLHDKRRTAKKTRTKASAQKATH